MVKKGMPMQVTFVLFVFRGRNKDLMQIMKKANLDSPRMISSSSSHPRALHVVFSTLYTESEKNENIKVMRLLLFALSPLEKIKKQMSTRLNVRYVMLKIFLTK